MDNLRRRFATKGKSRITTKLESPTGRNLRFEVPGEGNLSRQALVQQIRAGEQPGYHVRVINGLATPVSNPNGYDSDNLGRRTDVSCQLNGRGLLLARFPMDRGDPCGECGNYTPVRNGTCMKCNTCGGTSGCS